MGLPRWPVAVAVATLGYQTNCPALPHCIRPRSIPFAPFLAETIIDTLRIILLNSNRYSSGQTDASHGRIEQSLSTTNTHSALLGAMEHPTTPGRGHYGRPPAYDEEDGISPQLQGGSTMRLLTNVDESQSYMP